MLKRNGLLTWLAVKAQLMEKLTVVRACVKDGITRLHDKVAHSGCVGGYQFGKTMFLDVGYHC